MAYQDPSRTHPAGVFFICERCAGPGRPAPALLVRSLRRWGVGREVADIERGQQQFGFRQDGLRLRNHVRVRMVATFQTVMQRGLHLWHALADFLD